MTKLNQLLLTLLVCCLTSVLSQDCNNTFFVADKFSAVDLARPRYLSIPATASDLP